MIRAENQAEAAGATLDRRNVADRRRHVRWPAWAISSIAGVRLFPGGEVELINISTGGALVEGGTRYAPGLRVTFQITGTLIPDRIEARIVRCRVVSIHADGSLRYQIALAFDQHVKLMEEASGALPPSPMRLESAEPERDTSDLSVPGDGPSASDGTRPRASNSW